MRAYSNVKWMTLHSDLYKFLATINTFRTQQGSAVYNAQQVERYVDDQFFAFTRGMVRQIIVFS